MVELLEGIKARNHKYVFWADYVELQNLRLMYLKHEIHVGFGFDRPGATHKACWISKLLLSIKIFVLKHYTEPFKILSNAQLLFVTFVTHIFIQ